MSLEDRIKEHGAEDSFAYGNVVLFGKHGRHWDYFYDEVDITWWKVQITLFMSGGVYMPDVELSYTLPLWVKRN